MTHFFKSELDLAKGVSNGWNFEGHFSADQICEPDPLVNDNLEYKHSVDKMFGINRFMNRHTDKLNTTFTCKHAGCNRTFTKLGNIRNHVIKHTNSKPFKCESCKKTYTQKGNLVKHVIQKHDFRPMVGGKPSKQQIKNYYKLKLEALSI
jgi:hypothetical protein